MRQHVAFNCIHTEANIPTLRMILPDDFVATSPERLLLSAILERAIRDIIDHNKSKRCAEAAAKRQAWTWIKSDAVSLEYFTFVVVCECLDLDPLFVRKKILSEINSPEFLDCFEKAPGHFICDLRKRRRRAPVRYHKKDMLGRGLNRRSTSKASDLGTKDPLVYASSPDAE